MESRSRSISVALVVCLDILFLFIFGDCHRHYHSFSTHRDPETIISNGSAFKSGFFSPNKNSSNRYVGIWYNDKSETVIWVANRNKPLNDPSGIVTISENGNPVVLNGHNEVLWSSNVSNSVTNVSAQLLDIRILSLMISPLESAHGKVSKNLLHIFTGFYHDEEFLSLLGYLSPLNSYLPPYSLITGSDILCSAILRYNNVHFLGMEIVE